MTLNDVAQLQAYVAFDHIPLNAVLQEIFALFLDVESYGSSPSRLSEFCTLMSA